MISLHGTVEVSSKWSLHVLNERPDVAAAWDEAADIRAQELALSRDASYRALTRYVVESVSSLHYMRPLRILDAGCGVGFLSRALSSVGHSVVGVDISPRSIELSVERFGDSTDFVVTDVAQLPRRFFRSFDLVIANMTLHNVAHLGRFLDGCAAALHSEGTFMFTITDPRQYLAKQCLEHTYSRERTFLVPLKPHGSQSVYPDVPYFHRPLSTYLNAFTATGLRVGRTDEPFLGGRRTADIFMVQGSPSSRMSEFDEPWPA